MEKYGVEYATQSKEIQNKIKETCMEKYGVENPSQNENIKIKKEETCMKNYGVKSPFQMEETKEKNRIVMTENKKDIMEKRKQKSLQNWGVEHPAQNAEISEKSSKNAYKRKSYTFPSGRIDMVQGTEPLALDELLNLEKINENDIITERTKVPVCWWIGEDGKKHRYFVDIFIQSQNRCIEAKSTWTAEKKKECIFLKQKALKDLGYICEIWIYDNKNKKVECYK